MLRAGSRPPPYAAVSIHCSPSLLASFGQIIWIKKAPLCAIMPGPTPPPSVARIKLFGARHEREPEGKGRSSRSSTLYLLLSGRIGCHFFPCRRGERAQSRGVTCPARSTELRANQTPSFLPFPSLPPTITFTSTASLASSHKSEPARPIPSPLRSHPPPCRPSTTSDARCLEYAVRQISAYKEAGASFDSRHSPPSTFKAYWRGGEIRDLARRKDHLASTR